MTPHTWCQSSFADQIKRGGFLWLQLRRTLMGGSHLLSPWTLFICFYLDDRIWFSSAVLHHCCGNRKCPVSPWEPLIPAVVLGSVNLNPSHRLLPFLQGSDNWSSNQEPTALVLKAWRTQPMCRELQLSVERSPGHRPCREENSSWCKLMTGSILLHAGRWNCLPRLPVSASKDS